VTFIDENMMESCLR